MLTKRRLSLALCCALGLMPGRTFAQAGKNDDLAQQVLKAQDTLAKAQVAGDQATMDRLFADGFTHTHSSGGVQEKASFMNDLKLGSLH